MARFIPNINAEPAVPPTNAPVACVSVNAETTISRNKLGISPMLMIRM